MQYILEQNLYPIPGILAEENIKKYTYLTHFNNMNLKSQIILKCNSDKSWQQMKIHFIY